ncbi:MAG TPA: histone deacetylase family protein [Mesorhizobium sp.]|jgi:acetoin utilization deacetylase AcuC-like enzyme|nr:histone deacetylase family protein [Mesorhizobium sp.]
MRIIYTEDHRGHGGAMELMFNRMVPMFDKPERMDMILGALRRVGLDQIEQPKSFGLEPILAVHDAGFVAFLETAYGLWEKEFGPGSFATAYMFGMRGMNQTPNASVHSMLSCYTFDVCVPFVPGTWQAIRTSADVALTGQKLIGEGAGAVFSLCRPPGHHASRDLAGGYCYLNNAAIAAQAYRDAGAERVAILDVDYHHGNGTQLLFYSRSDVLYVSLHARPEEEYPFLLGYASEHGEGTGEGFNANHPMPKGTTWNSYRDSLAAALGRIRAYAPDVLVVSLGVDTFKGDPVSSFALETGDYLEVGSMIAELALPTQFVMEGGYAIEALGENVANVLTGFADRSPR